MKCQKCNKEYQKHPKASKSLFCESCRWIKCVVCGKDKKLNTIQIQSNVAKYCSHACENSLALNRFKKNGYWCVKSDHPRSYNGFYYEHILIIEKLIGRFLNTKFECVHHKDYNKLNNNIDNLELTTRSKHGSIHLKPIYTSVDANIDYSDLVAVSKKKKSSGIKLERGYIVIWNPRHPMARKNGYVFAHRLIMSQYLNRLLDRSEIVHHVNGNKKDNRIENLELLTREIHIKKHIT